jgi:predicted metalloprotease with PDZ domain
LPGQLRAANPASGRGVLACLIAALLLAAARPLGADEPVRYRLSFPEPEHRWMQVEATFAGLGPEPLELRMSRSSPGRYSLHDFAKNVYDVRAEAADGRMLAAVRSDAHSWTVAGHDGAVTLRYKVYGDRVDGTYLAIDPTHAHVNMPAALIWARGLQERPAVVTLEPPAGRTWEVATQLFEGSGPLEFTAPNLQYLMDSPVEFGPLVRREFAVSDRRFRIALHHTGTVRELDAFTRDVERIVREQGEIFGEYPPFEPGHYTFIGDFLPFASGDAMEHRNSTIITSPGSLEVGRLQLLESAAHEFFHVWNVERIRPRSLEPFDFERANLSGELWLAEGFTQYYGLLTLSRANLAPLDRTLAALQGLIVSVALNPARLVRSAEEMSQMAVFTDGGRTVDRTNWPTTVISYYQFGGALALALDLALRGRSGGRLSLDDYMRALWKVHGAGGDGRPGFVERPYTMVDAEARLAEVSGDAAFARDFFVRYIRGHEVPDFEGLLQPAGLALRRTRTGHPWLGDVRLDDRSGAVRVASPTPYGSPLYTAGLDVDDEIREVDGTRIRSVGDVTAVLQRRRPGDVLTVVYADRTGAARSGRLTLGEDPELELVAVEASGGTLSASQRAFRERWLD